MARGSGWFGAIAAWIVLAPLLFTSPASAAPPPPPQAPEESIVVANGTKSPLTCRMRGQASDWTAYETIAPDFALSVPSQPGGKSYLECRPPVSQTIYEMLAGQQYRLIRKKAGEPVELRSVAAAKK